MENYFSNVFISCGYFRILIFDAQQHTYNFVSRKTIDVNNCQYNSDYQIPLVNRKSHYRNLIVDIDTDTLTNTYEDILCKMICGLLCNSVQFRCVGSGKIMNLLNKIRKLHIVENLEILISEAQLCDELILVLNHFNYSNLIIICPTVKHLKYQSINYNPFETNKEFYCFQFNLQFYIEAQFTNPYYYNKLYVDFHGNIYNSPELTGQRICHVYDNILQIKRALDEYNSHNVCLTPKVQIEICKDCELRFVCMDNRLVENNKLYYYYKRSCPYNPYICLWEGQDGYVPVKQCGTYSRETGFIPDKKRIAELNKKIWGEE